MSCPYPIREWSRAYVPGDFFDASTHFDVWRGYAALRWIGTDGLFYCDLFLDQDDPELRTGAGTFTRAEIEDGFELVGGPTCRAELAELRQEPPSAELALTAGQFEALSGLIRAAGDRLKTITTPITAGMSGLFGTFSARGREKSDMVE